MTGWLRHHLLSLARTLRRLAEHPLDSTLNVLVIGVALALPLGGYVLLLNVQQLAGKIETEPQISVFLAPEAGKSDIAAIDRRLQSAAGVRKVAFVSRDQALAGLKQAPGMAEVIATLRANPLPDAFVVTLTNNDTQVARRLEREFRNLPRVAHVQVDSAWVERVDGLLKLGHTAVILLAALLSFALIAVAFNTIRLQIVTQSDEIEVSKLIGATNAYIRRPFYYLGVLQGLLGGLAAIALVQVAIFFLDRDLAGLANAYGAQISLQVLGPVDGFAVLAFSATIGWLGAYVSVSRHLSQVEPR